MNPHISPSNQSHTQLTLSLMRRGVLGKQHRVPEPVLQFLLRGPKKASVQVGWYGGVAVVWVLYIVYAFCGLVKLSCKCGVWQLTPRPCKPTHKQENPLPWLPLPAWQAVRALCDQVDGFAKLGQVWCANSDYDLYIRVFTSMRLVRSVGGRTDPLRSAPQISPFNPHTYGVQDMVEASPRFREWYGSLAPESEKLPLGACLRMYICALCFSFLHYVGANPRPRAPADQRKQSNKPTRIPNTEWAGLDRTPILKMLVVRCLRPDRMTVALTNFIRAVLPNGERKTKPQ